MYQLILNNMYSAYAKRQSQMEVVGGKWVFCMPKFILIRENKNQKPMYNIRYFKTKLRGKKEIED